MTPAQLLGPGNGMITTWVILAVEWVVFMVLALYLEQVRGHKSPFVLSWIRQHQQCFQLLQVLIAIIQRRDICQLNPGVRQ